MKNKKQEKTIYEPLDNYEKMLESFLDKGNFVSSKKFKENKKSLQKVAVNHRVLRESKSITLRINKADLIKVKAKAIENKIPYQTLISLLVRQYVAGRTEVHL